MKFEVHFLIWIGALVKSMALFGFMVVFAGPAEGQKLPSTSAEFSALENQYSTLLGGLRALSSCPDLIEDWEYDAQQKHLDELSNQLAGVVGREVPVSSQRKVLLKAVNLSCDSPHLQALASELRASVHIRWMAMNKVMTENGACAEAMGTSYQSEHLETLKRAKASMEERVPNQVEARQAIAKMANRIERELQSACENHAPQRGRYDEQLSSVMGDLFAPIFSGEFRAQKQYRERYFDLTLGFTMTMGETRSVESAGRESSVLAKRAPDPINSKVLLDYSACGHFLMHEDLRRARVCRVSLDQNGGLAMVSFRRAGSEWIPLEWTGDAILRVYDPTTGEIIQTLEPVQKDGVVLIGKYPANGVTYFEDVISKTVSLHPLMQLNIMLIDEQGEELKLLQGHEGASGPRTVAIGDLRRASAYAYAQNSADLTTGGLTEEFYLEEKARLEAVE